jgi:hypothetical protein
MTYLKLLIQVKTLDFFLFVYMEKQKTTGIEIILIVELLRMERHKI